MLPLKAPLFSKAPPIKTQGIKTKIVPHIAESVRWNGKGRWIEPFMGSAAVALNIAPEKALLCDTNKHLVNLYIAIQNGKMDGKTVRSYLQKEGALLSEKGEIHYYYVRDRFNEREDEHDFLFLSRSCFNGLMRFNRRGEFNVPFCRKPERFRKALVTKIVNQVEWASMTIRSRNWKFKTQDWRKTLSESRSNDIIYCDPPYVGRHTDYFNSFDDQEADDLAASLKSGDKNFVLSNWLENKYRRNKYVDMHFSDYEWRYVSHFYHIGSSEKLRNKMKEVVVLSAHVVASSRDMT